VYWTNPRELYGIRDADIGWDEIGKDLPAGSWGDTPKELKQVFSHLRKRGNRIFANTQVYEDIDISFRRQIDKAYKIEKLMGSRDISATLPPLKKVWGVITVREFDPLELENVKEGFRKNIGGLPKIILLRKKYVEMYDTKMELPPYMPDKLEHREMECTDPNCDHIRVIHRTI